MVGIHSRGHRTPRLLHIVYTYSACGESRSKVAAAFMTALLCPRPPNEKTINRYFDAVNRSAAALGSTGGSNLPPPPSPRALRQNTT